MADEQQKRGGGGIGEGIRSGIGILNAFREAVEETVQEVVDRGDLKPDRAKQAVKDAAHRMQEVFDDARERLDFVPRAEFDALREEVEALRRRVDHLHPSGALATSSFDSSRPFGGNAPAETGSSTGAEASRTESPARGGAGVATGTAGSAGTPGSASGAAGDRPRNPSSGAGPEGGIIEVPGREPPPEPADGGPRIVIESE